MSILGLAVLLICVVFFLPINYRMNAECEGNLDSLHANAGFSWLFHLISGNVSYDSSKLNWNIRIAWKKVGQDQNAERNPSEKKKRRKAPEREVEPGTDRDRMNKPGEGTAQAEKEAENILKKEIPESSQDGTSVDRTEKQEDKASSFYQKIKYTFCRIYDKIKLIIHKICSAIKAILEKKDKLTEFITDEVHRAAWGKVLIELRRLLHFLKPHKLNLSVLFGFGDPAVTGYVLAAGSMLSPFLGKHTNIRPDFEQEILEGNLFVSGKIRVIYFVISLWNLIWNKNIRITFRHIKNIKAWISN